MKTGRRRRLARVVAISIKIDECVFKMMDFALKMMNFVFYNDETSMKMDRDNMWGGFGGAVCEKIKGFVAGAKAKGAKFLTGADTPLSKGYFFSPTVITDVGINDDVWQKEVRMLRFVYET